MNIEFRPSTSGGRGVWGVRWSVFGLRRRMGFASTRDAVDAVLPHLRALADAASLGLDIPAPTLDWLRRRCSAELAEKLVQHRLVSRDVAARTRGLDRHLEDFRAHLVEHRRTPQHVRETLSKIRAVFTACGVRDYADLAGSASDIQRWIAQAGPARAGRRRKPAEDSGGRPAAVAADPTPSRSGKAPPRRSARTKNAYAAAVLQFCAWMVRYRGESFMPAIERTPFSVKADRRRRRFTLGPARFSGLLAATQQRRDTDCGMDGPTRATLWWLAAETGYRARELAQITPAGLKLASIAVDDGGAAVRVLEVRVPSTKAGEPAVQAVVSPELIDRVVGLAARTVPLMPLFPVRIRGTARTVEALRRDLIAAGINPVAADGSVYDLHALRHELAHHLLDANPVNAAVRDTIRHASLELTLSTYHRPRLAAQVGALLRRQPIVGPGNAVG